MLMGFNSASFSWGACSCSTAMSLSGSPPMNCTRKVDFISYQTALRSAFHMHLEPTGSSREVHCMRFEWRIPEEISF